MLVVLSGSVTTNHITTKLTYQNQDQRYKYHHPMTTLHLTLKMTTAQVVEASVTNNSLSKDYLHPDDHVKQIKAFQFGYIVQPNKNEMSKNKTPFTGGSRGWGIGLGACNPLMGCSEECQNKLKPCTLSGVGKWQHPPLTKSWIHPAIKSKGPQ